MALANYCASGRNERTAYVEVYGHGELSQWKKANDEGFFKEQDVYYYPDYGKERIAKMLNMDYDRIIMDFGDAYLSHREEIMRCDKKIFLLSLSPWQKFSSTYLIRTVKNEEWGSIRPVFASVAASENEIKEVEREFKIEVEQIPIMRNPCCIPGNVFSELENFLDSVPVNEGKRLSFPFRRRV